MLTPEDRQKVIESHRRIQQQHQRTEKPSPRRSCNAWDAPKNSHAYRMRGLKSCPECEGNGDRWAELPTPWGIAWGGFDVLLANRSSSPAGEKRNERVVQTVIRGMTIHPIIYPDLTDCDNLEDLYVDPRKE